MTQFKPILTVSGKRGRPLISRLLPLFFQVVTLPFKTRYSHLSHIYGSGFRGREYSVRVLFREFNVRPVRGVRRRSPPNCIQLMKIHD